MGETAELEGAAEQPSGQNSGSRQIQPINRINTIEASSRTTRVYLQSHSHKQLLPTLGKCQILRWNVVLRKVTIGRVDKEGRDARGRILQLRAR
jgi:hypothetical protein